MLDLLRKALMYKRWSNDRLFSALGDLSAAALMAPQPIKFGSLARTLQHVFDMDSVWCAHHRGHISDMLYNLGKPSPATDFPVFLREMRGDDRYPGLDAHQL